MFRRSTCIIPSAFPNDQCNIGTAKARQLICLFHETSPPSSELLGLCFRSVRHFICFVEGKGKLSKGGRGGRWGGR